MDPKKSLKPELKDIYEKVMSTKTGSRPAAPVSSPTQIKTPTPPTAAAAKQTATQSPVQQSTPAASNQEPFLSGTSPRPVTNMDAFVFSNHGKKADKPEKKIEKKAETVTPKAEVKSSESNQKSSKLYPVLVASMFIFIVLWTVFWAIFLGVI